MNKSELEELALLLEEQDKRATADLYWNWFPDTGPHRRELYPKHMAFYEAGNRYQNRAMICANRVGKEVRCSEPVLTPDGFVRIDSLKVGDTLCDPEGGTCQVLGIYPQGKKQIYRVYFNDGSYVDCGIDHLWRCKGPEQRFRKNSGEYQEWQVKSLREIIDHTGMNPMPGRRYAIPVVSELTYNDKPLPVDPYTLGALLGDGSIESGTRFHTADEEMLSYLQLGCVTSIARQANSDCKTYGYTGQVPDLREAGIYGLGCKEKSIPDAYKYHSRRLEVLQGLMDTDGYPGESTCEFSSTSPKLAQDVVDICRSLGMRCTLKKKVTTWVYKGIRKHGEAYRVAIWNTNIPLFRLKRKLSKQKLDGESKNGTENIIVRVEAIDIDDALCIEVNSKYNTYIISNYVVTHNTTSCLFEIRCHMTGLYPKWWKGYRYTGPVTVWLCSDTAKSLRDNVQHKLIGSPDAPNSGMIPEKYLAAKPLRKHGISEAKDKVSVKHISGGVSNALFKSYEEGRESFQGTEIHIILLDEEPPLDVYIECLLRTMHVDHGRTRGMMLLAFTPLRGMSEVVLKYLPNGKFPQKMEYNYIIQIDWDDVPHLGEEEKARMLAEMDPYSRDARSKGIPALGKGAIYPIPDEEIMVDWFQIPEEWPRFYGFDYGYTRTAAVFVAVEPNTDNWYIYDCYVQDRAQVDVHVAALKAKGADWMLAASESALINSQTGEKMIDIYKSHGLRLLIADKSLEAGIAKVWQMLSSGKLKVFKTCRQWFQEKNVYHKEEDGKITNLPHDLMDCTRYACIGSKNNPSLKLARVNPNLRRDNDNDWDSYQSTKDSVTGY